MFVVVGDCHLGKQNVEIYPQDPDAQAASVLHSIRQCFDWCKKNGVKEVVFAGDLFDTPFPSQEIITALADLLAEYPDLKFVVIPGNHDLVTFKKHSLTTLSWIGKRELIQLNVVMTPTLMKIDGHKCWVVPHPFHTEPEKKVDWCIGHFPWTGAKRDNGSVNDGSRKNPKGRWLLGDFHTYQKGPNYWYAGSMTQLNRQEQGPKGFLAIDGDDVRFVQVQKQYEIRSHTLTKVKELKQLAKQEDGVKLYWWIKITDPDVVMPANWQIDYPQVLNYDAPRVAANSNVKQEFDDLTWTNDPLESLAAWMTERKVAAKDQKKITRIAVKLRKAKKGETV